MYWFLLPLVAGLVFHAASAFTSLFSRRLGQRRGQTLSAVLRNLLGIPLWASGFVLALRARSALLFQGTVLVDMAAWLLILCGSFLVVSGLWALRGIAAAPSMEDRLVRHGIYAHVRHPIHAGTLLEFAGLTLLTPTGAAWLALALGTAWVFAQTRLEEADLLQRAPGYAEYIQQVPCFVPRLCSREANYGRSR